MNLSLYLACTIVCIYMARVKLDSYFSMISLSLYRRMNFALVRSCFPRRHSTLRNRQCFAFRPYGISTRLVRLTRIICRYRTKRLRLLLESSFTSSRERTRKVDDDDDDARAHARYSRGSFLSRSSVFLINNYRRCPRSGLSLLSILRYIRPNRFEYYMKIESRAEVETLDLSAINRRSRCILMRKPFEAPRIKSVNIIGHDINT